MTGWAWMIMLVVTIVNLYRTRSIAFPWQLWLLWMLYICGYLVIDFSFLGLQLTLQYMLPLLIGIVASGFIYTTEISTLDVQVVYHDNCFDLHYFCFCEYFW